MSIPENKTQPSLVLGNDTHEKWRQKVNETIDRINSLYQSDQELWVDGNVHNKGYHSLKNSSENETIKIDANGDSYILSGNVGIGTSSPPYRLTVKGVGSAYTLAAEKSGSSNWSGIWENFTGDHEFYLKNSSENNTVKLDTNGDSYFIGGNVGIGTTSPDTPLQVQGATSGMVLDGEIISIKTATDDHRLSLGVDSDNEFAWVRSVKGGSELPLILGNGGKVGIGTTSPSFGLLQIQNSEGVNNFLSLRSTGTGNRMLSTWVDDTNSTINFDSRYSTGGSYDFRFRAGSTELMRIDSSGNVGIGTASPRSRLEVREDITTAYSTTGAPDPALIIYNAGDLVATDTATSMLLEVRSSNGTSQPVYLNAIQNAGTYTPDFSISTRTGSTTYAERLRIDSSGKVGIGGATPAQYHTNANDLVLGTTSGAHGITILSKDDLGGSIFFADGSSDTREDVGGIIYQHATNRFDFVTNNSIRWRLDSGTLYPLANQDLGSSTSRVGSGWFVDLDISGYFLPDSAGVKLQTNSNSNPLKISRYASTFTSEFMNVGLDDGNVWFTYQNDEANSRIRFRMINTDTETGGGANSSDFTPLTLYSSKATGALIGINNISPTSTLDVVGNGYFEVSGTGRMSVLALEGRHTSSSYTADQGASLDFYVGRTGASGDDFRVAAIGGHLRRYDSGDATADGYIAFYTKPDDSFSSQSLTERMRISHEGNVGIGTSSPGQLLEINDGTLATQITGNRLMWNRDTDPCYIDQSGNGGIQFRSGAGFSNTVFIEDGGNVGIGTTGPTTKLHVYSSASGDNLTIDGVAGNNRNINFETGGSQRWAVVADGTAESGSEVGSDFRIYRYNDAGALLQTAFFIKRSDGNVGIGTSSPSWKLHTVIDTDNSAETDLRKIDGVHITNDDNTAGSKVGLMFHAGSASGIVGERLDNDNMHLHFVTEPAAGGDTGRAKMTLLSGGNVGIGTTEPGEKLRIADLSLDQLRLERTDGVGWDFRAGSSGSLIFKDDGVERVRIDEEGRFNMSGADVDGNASWHGQVLIASNSNFAGKSILTLRDIVNQQETNIEMHGGWDGVSYGKSIISAGSDSQAAYSGYLAFKTQSWNGLSYETNERMRISALGNVGIGTSNPGSGDSGTLDVVGFIETYGLRSNRGDGDLYLQVAANTDNVYIGGTSSDSTKSMVWNDGDVGIGTTNPTQRLHVVASSNDIARFESSLTNGSATIELKPQSTAGVARIDVVDIASDFRLSTVNTADAFVVEDGGNVGIGRGASDILTKLHVESSANPVLTLESDTSQLENNFGTLRFVNSVSANSNYYAEISAYNPSDQYGDQRELHFKTGIAGNDQVMRLDQYGRLHVKSEDVNAYIYINSAGVNPSGDTGITFQHTDALDVVTNHWTLLNDHSGANNFSIFNNVQNESAIIIDSGTSDVNIQNGHLLVNDGNVGIGAASTGQLLYVYGSTSAVIDIDRGTGSGNTILRFKEADVVRGQAFIDGGDSDKFKLRVGTSTDFLVADTSGNVGIGTSSPLFTLDVAGTLNTSSDATINGDLDVTGNNLSIGTTTQSTSNLSMLSTNTGEAKILFGDSDDVDVGRILYNHELNELQFYTANAEQWNINSTGVLTGDGKTLSCDTILAVSNYSSIVSSSTSIDATGSAPIRSVNGSIETTGSGDIQTTGTGDIISANDVSVGNDLSITGDITSVNDVTVNGSLSATGIFVPFAIPHILDKTDYDGLTSHGIWKILNYTDITTGIPDGAILLARVVIYTDKNTNVSVNSSWLYMAKYNATAPAQDFRSQALVYNVNAAENAGGDTASSHTVSTTTFVPDEGLGTDNKVLIKFAGEDIRMKFLGYYIP